ncbi:nuclear transport factor 2 family protein [Bdellovibrio bacteriovorus]|uniref:SnoaL-like domain-containing protein n=1 Tax=Bdellovibrio bacteriovorus TaxID=959 RepID=A0A1Z3NDI4_BDEBC|nr:nuclear transport factor 2 family protein [Bdellovibrio bacteriovorus]ASD65505.1 hypothetical protein B9G79_11890 [Bdellovibrio bacteriovorus]
MESNATLNVGKKLVELCKKGDNMKDFDEQMEMHGIEVEGPFPFGDRFAVHYKMDATEKKTNKRIKMEEVALYTVKDGKIVKEEFFYRM